MEHLPECPKAIIEPTLYYFGIPLSKSDSVCICDALRACERRVIGNLSRYTWLEGYAAGHLDAFEEAEEAINKAPRTSNLMITLQDALAAICALREEK